MYKVDLGDGYAAVPRDAVTLNGYHLTQLNTAESDYSGQVILLLPSGAAAMGEDGQRPYIYSDLAECRKDKAVLLRLNSEADSDIPQSLPVTEEEWAATPRPVPLEPDARDLYIAGHVCLKPCPFCGSNPLAMGERNPQSKLFGYRIQCPNFRCNGNVFTCEETREGARDRAIQNWERRT